jgi:multidrug efflux pump subunit AcrA (membrane-fusion protein)
LAGEGATVLDLRASVKLSAPGHAIIWPAKVTRVGEAIDARTQNAPVIVRVDDPQAASIAGERPPLRKNMFVEIELSAPKQKALVVPAEAVQNGTALVVSKQATLEKRPVEYPSWSRALWLPISSFA